MELLKCNYLLPASVNHMQRWFLAVKTNDLNIDIKYNRKKEQQRKHEALAAETSPPYEILLVQEDSQSQKGLHNISNLKFIIHLHRGQSEDMLWKINSWIPWTQQEIISGLCS